MKFPKSTKEHNEIVTSGSLPEAQELEGEYLVTMLALPVSRRIFPDSKIFYSESGKAVGHNRLFRNLKWGRFFLEKGTLEKFGSLPVLVVNYNMPENTFLTRPIRDELRRVEMGVYLGRFNLFLGGKMRFLGYFLLVRK